VVSVYDLKPAFQNKLRGIANWLARQGITANQVTIAAVLLSASVGILFTLFPDIQKIFFILPLVIFVRMALNAIDGMLAREHNMQSTLGAFLNELGDVFSDAFLYLPFAFISGISPILVVIMVLLSVISEMTGVVAIQVGANRRYDGPMGKSDRAFLMGALTVGLGFGLPVWWMNPALVLMTCLLVVTVGNRVSQSLKEVQ
jgi:CDP-diacylglycerol---glycerol-3-phosphate 3-phosphatidyltransferase